MIPVFKPRLPLVDTLLPYLKELDQNQQYTNNGPLLLRFEERLADHFKVSADQLCTSANGTLALIQMLKSLNLPKGAICALPSWTFVASVAAVVAAELTPYFLDVDESTWALSPDHVLHALRTTEVRAVLVVAPFGAPIAFEAWEALQAKTGIPVLIDAAAGFDTFSSCQTTLPFMISLHATKVFGIGEGAIIVGDSEFIKRCRSWGQFGFQQDRVAHCAGINAKLSEYAAAVGLAGLDQWGRTRQEWQSLKNHFLQASAGFDLMPGFEGDWVSCYGQVLTLEKPSVSFETRQWWQGGCHTHPAYQHYPKMDLSVTEKLARQCWGVPYWLGLTSSQLTAIFAELRAVQRISA
ncbi:MAG: DegT/DnrJ/EryC1/StrS family aminotransferase [Candidatus Paracaedibacteraceae bacterium]|nr:DegT/DnrJ/EryC1/StrS family aminotransferase [Candidatus Paracaedibacteraceae bacterium]